MEIRNTNIEIRKNWNKFTFKKLGAILCLFLFGIVTFVSGNLSQVNAASSSTVLPVAKGGTGSNSASGAATNILGDNYANYSGILPIAKGGTGANSAIQAQRNLQIGESYQYPVDTQSSSMYVRAGAVKIDTSSNGQATQVSIVSGITAFGNYTETVMVEMSGRINWARLSMLTIGKCDVWLYYYDDNNIRYYYITGKTGYQQTTSVKIIQSNPQNPVFSPHYTKTLPSNAKEMGQATCRS
ncbi:MAG: hypothetical protein LBT99_00695 [Bifidobacteriaceae bacterium]|jgi:hypothetical protein|nr:hypothetical protein [Bifidobacteriaceae bacterium]